MSLATKAFAGFDVDGRHVRLVITDASSISDAVTVARAELDSSFDVFSGTRRDSELRRLNSSFGRTVRVSPAMAEQLRHALAAAGSVSPLRSGSWQDIEFDGVTVRLPQWSTLDLDATAVSAAADRVAASIARRFACDVTVTISGGSTSDRVASAVAA